MVAAVLLTCCIRYAANVHKLQEHKASKVRVCEFLESIHDITHFKCNQAKFSYFFKYLTPNQNTCIKSCTVAISWVLLEISWCSFDIEMDTFRKENKQTKTLYTQVIFPVGTICTYSLVTDIVNSQ